MKFDQNAKYQDTHEWARKEGDLIVVGISDHAQDSLSDVVYVELPVIDDEIDKGDVFGVVESVKAASDLYMPVSGIIVEVNDALEDTPEVVNSDPFGEGWFIKVKPTNLDAEWDSLMDADAYAASIEGE
ncbi:MAG TPA: glycine cleavage system protein GcvH [Anaerolineae bacterium]|nr:glycine cleavage system protein GcvH [Anaerolineae bacterium]